MPNVTERQDPRELLEQAAMAPLQIVAVAICILLFALDGFDVLAISFAAPGIAGEWAINRGELGVVLATELVGMGVGSILLGGLADRVGRRPTILICLVVVTSGMYAAALTSAVEQLLIARLVTGLGIGGMLASVNALVAEYSSLKYRNLAVVLVAAGYPLGATCGGWVASRLLEGGDWRVVFEFGALCTGVFIVVVWFFLPESIQYLLKARPSNALKKVNVTLAKMGHATMLELPAASMDERSLRYSDLFNGPYRRVTLLLSLGFFSHFTTFYFVLKWIPKIVVDMGYDPSSAGMVLVWANVGGISGALLFGFLAQRLTLRPVLIAVLFLSAMMVALFGAGQSSLNSLSLVAAATGFFTNAGVVGFYALLAASFPVEVRAGATGVVIGLGRGGAVLGPTLAGLLFSLGAGLFVTATLLGLGALIAAAAVTVLGSEHGGSNRCQIDQSLPPVGD